MRPSNARANEHWTRSFELEKNILLVVAIAVQAGGGVHGVQEASSRPATKDHRLLRASVPRENVRRKENSRGSQRVPQRGLTFSVLELVHIPDI